MLLPSQLRLVAVLGLILSAQASAPIFVREKSASSSGAEVGAAASSGPNTGNSGDNTPPISTPSTSPSQQVTTPPTSKSTPPSTSPQTSPPSTSGNGQGNSSSSKSAGNTPTPTSSPSSSSRDSTTPHTSPTSINTGLITPPVVLVTQVYTSSGSLISQVYSSTDNGAFSSAIAAATSANAALASNTSKGSESGGMSTQTRNTIIGVVVGIGGAAIFAGLFVVAWRIWGRKRSQLDESDGLVGTGFGTAPGEKPVAGTSAANPFQSTLETYHNPARGNVNASSNF